MVWLSKLTPVHNILVLLDSLDMAYVFFLKVVYFMPKHIFVNKLKTEQYDRHFAIDIFECISFFEFKFHQQLLLGYKWQYHKSSANNLAPHTCQAITWNNGDPIYCIFYRHQASID